MTESESVTPVVYEAPRLLASLGSILRASRAASYSTKFSDIFSDDAEVQHKYAKGLVAVGFFFIVFYVIWAFVLIVLKFKGRDVGCASGRPFQKIKIDNTFSTDSSSGGEYSVEDDLSSNLGPIDEVHPQEDYDSAGSPGYDEYEGEEHSQRSWISEREERIRRLKEPEILLIENPREKRTRSAFLLFSVLSLALVPFILVFSFSPMKEATDGSRQNIMLVDDVLDTMASAFTSIEEARESAITLVDALPRDVRLICPLIFEDNMEEEIGVDLRDIMGVLIDELNTTDSSVVDRLDYLGNILEKMQEGTSLFEGQVDLIEKWMWIVPGVLFTVSVISAISMLGTILAWKNNSGPRVQKFMSYFVLPILILSSIACWATLIASSFGTMLTSDICTSGPAPGSPENTIEEILSIRNWGENDTVYQLIHEYTNACPSYDPTEYMTSLEREVQEHVDNIWRQISIIDSIGRANIIEKCGDDSLTELLRGARRLAKLMTAVRRSLRTAGESLDCGHIYPIYTQTVHDTLCTDTASAAGYGFIFFLVLAISTMIMISLRASWLQNSEDENVYQDEDDIAENMVVNEHEEYLAYISKYKHEWEEYKGFNSSSSTFPSSTFPSNSFGGEAGLPVFHEEDEEYFDEDEFLEEKDDDNKDQYTSDDAYHASDEYSDDVSGYITNLKSKSAPLSGNLQSPTRPPAKNPAYLNDISLDQTQIPESEESRKGGIEPEGIKMESATKSIEKGLAGTMHRFTSYFNNTTDEVEGAIDSEEKDGRSKDEEDLEKTESLGEESGGILPSFSDSHVDLWI